MKWSIRLFFLYTLLLPTQLSKHFWTSSSFVQGLPVDYLSPTLYLTDIIFLGIITFLVFENRIQQLLLSNSKYFVILLVLSAAHLYLSHSSFWISVYFLIRLFQSVIIFAFVWENFSDIKQSLHKPLLVSLAFLNALSLSQFMLGGSVGGVFYWFGERFFRLSSPGIARFTILGHEYLRPYATLPHPNVLAAYSFVACLMFYVITKKKWIFAFMIVPLVLSQSLNVYLSILLSLGVTKLIKKPSMIVPLFVIFFSLVLPFLYNQLSRFDASVLRRAALYEASVKSIDNIMFGSGIGMSIPHVAPLYTMYDIDSRWFLQPVHNLPLVVLVETGVIGLLVLFMVSKIILKRAEVLNDRVYLFVLVFVFSTMLFDHYWWTILQTRNLLAIFFGLLFSVYSVKIQRR